MKSSPTETTIFLLTSFGLLWFLFLIPFFGSLFFCVLALPVTFCTWYPFFNLMNFFAVVFFFCTQWQLQEAFGQLEGGKSGDTMGILWGQLQMHVAFGASSFLLFSGVINRPSGGVGREYHDQGPQFQQQLRQRPEYSHPSGICICSVLQPRPIQLFMVKFITFWQDCQIEKKRTKCKVRVCLPSDTTSEQCE